MRLAFQYLQYHIEKLMVLLFTVCLMVLILTNSNL